MDYIVWVGGIPVIEKAEYFTALKVYYAYKYDKSYGDVIFECVPNGKQKT